MEKQRKYDREFKINAVKLYRESGKKIGEVASDLGILKGTLYTWINSFKEHGEDRFPKAL